MAAFIFLATTPPLPLRHAPAALVTRLPGSRCRREPHRAGRQFLPARFSPLCISSALFCQPLGGRSLISASGVCDVQVRRQGRCTSFHHGLDRVHARRRVMLLQVHCLAKHHEVACRFNSSRRPYPLLSLHPSPLTVRRWCETKEAVGAATPSGSRTIGERVRGRKSNGCASETFLFWRAAGEEKFAREAANKPFSLDFQVGSTFWVEAWNPLP